MRYQGGKARIARQVAEVIERYRDGRTTVLEPFCGELNVTAALTGPRIASDLSRPLFSLYSALRSGWTPPDEISEEAYALVKSRRDPDDPLTAFVGYGCSFGGKMFSGFARGRGEDYVRQAKTSLLRKFAACSDVTFACVPFDAWAPGKSTLVYCDPPYAGTTGYPGLPKFDSARFWSVADAWVAAGVPVLVSEFAAPSHWRPVWSADSFTGLGSKGAKDRPVEHVFAPA